MRNVKINVKYEKSDAKYLTIHFSFLPFRGHFMLFQDKYIFRPKNTSSGVHKTNENIHLSGLVVCISYCLDVFDYLYSVCLVVYTRTSGYFTLWVLRWSGW